MPIRTLAPKRVDLVGVPHRLEKGKSASEDAGPKGVDSGVPLWLGRRTKHHLQGSLEGKPERESPKLTISTVDLGRYTHSDGEGLKP